MGIESLARSTATSLATPSPHFARSTRNDSDRSPSQFRWGSQPLTLRVGIESLARSLHRHPASLARSIHRHPALLSAFRSLARSHATPLCFPHFARSLHRHPALLFAFRSCCARRSGSTSTTGILWIESTTLSEAQLLVLVFRCCPCPCFR